MMFRRVLLVALVMCIVGLTMARDPLLDDLPQVATLEAVPADGPMEQQQQQSLVNDDVDADVDADGDLPTLRFEEATPSATPPSTTKKTVTPELKKPTATVAPKKDSTTVHHGKKFVCSHHLGHVCTHYVRCASWQTTVKNGKTKEVCLKKFKDTSKLHRKVCTHFSKTSYENVDTFTCTRWKVCKSWTLTKGGNVKCTSWTGKFIHDKTFCVEERTRMISGKKQKYCKYARVCKVTKKVELKQGDKHVKPATHECLKWRGGKYLAGNHAYWSRLHKYKRMYQRMKRRYILDHDKLSVKSRRATRRRFLWRKYYKLYRSFKKKFYRAVMNASRRKAIKSKRASYLKGVLNGSISAKHAKLQKRCGVSRRLYAASKHLCHTARCKRRALKRYIKHCRKWRHALSQRARTAFRKCVTARTLYRAKARSSCNSTASDFAECKRKLRWSITRKACHSWRAIQRWRRRTRAYKQCKRAKSTHTIALGRCKSAKTAALKKACAEKADKAKTFECFPHKFFRTAALFYRNGRKQRRTCVAATKGVPAAIAKCGKITDHTKNMECVGKAATSAKALCTPFENFVTARKAFRAKYALVFKHRRCIVATRVFTHKNKKCGKNYACKQHWRKWKRRQCAPWTKANTKK